MQEVNLARISFRPRWDDVVRDDLMLVQEGKVERASFPPRWDDVVQDELFACARGKGSMS